MPYFATNLILPVTQNFATSLAGGRWEHTMVGTGAGTTSGVILYTNSTVYTVLFSSGMHPSSSSPAARTWTFSGVKKDTSTTLSLGPTISRNIIFPALATTSSAPADTTPPTVQILNPENGLTYHGTIPIVYDVDDVSGISSIQLIVTTTGSAISSSGLVWPVTTEFVTTTSMNGLVTLTILAVDASPGLNSTSASVTIEVDNAIISTSTGVAPATTLRRAAIINRVPDGRVVVALWAPVPTPAQGTFAQTGKVSAWTLASSDQNAAIAAGEIAERVRVLPAAGLTDPQILDMIEAEWTLFNDMIDDLGIWPQVNKFWLGSPGVWTS